jgi:hypothetical protein
MPAFSFEKISPPARRGQQSSTSPSPKKRQRGIIHQIVDRFAEARSKRNVEKTRGVSSRIEMKSADE